MDKYYIENPNRQGRQKPLMGNIMDLCVSRLCKMPREDMKDLFLLNNMVLFCTEFSQVHDANNNLIS